MSIIIIGLGVFIILNKDAFDLIGLLIMIYAIIDIIESIIFRKNIKLNKDNNLEIIEAEIVEEKKNKKKKKK